MPVWVWPIKPSPRSPLPPRRGSILAISLRCCMRRGIGGTSLWRGSHSASSRSGAQLRTRGRDHADGIASQLLHAERHEPQLALAVGDQEQHGLLAVLLDLVDALFD